MSSTIRPMEQFVKTLLAARRVSTPLVAIRTADPALTVARIEEAVGRDAAIVQWDIVRGRVRVNDAGAKEIGRVLGERDPVGLRAGQCAKHSFLGSHHSSSLSVCPRMQADLPPYKPKAPAKGDRKISAYRAS